ncbi:MAG: tetratricopeptide repeat protein [Muribaculaceae bacterium]|nr:tetratricopeptide repeat protein [Muribaculaceae bacterium]
MNPYLQSLDEIKKLPPQEAISHLNRYITDNPDSDEAFVERGLNYWKMGKRREAINDYHHALTINPQSRAAMLIEYSKSILDFYNKDLLNP